MKTPSQPKSPFRKMFLFAGLTTMLCGSVSAQEARGQDTPQDLNYIVQANTNLATANWVGIATNTAPFVIKDTAFTNQPQRFYRALYKP